MADPAIYRDPDPALITACHLTLALHALGLAIGAFGAATVVGSFLFGWPSIIAGIIGLAVLGISAIYRVARGWLRLQERRPVA